MQGAFFFLGIPMRRLTAFLAWLPLSVGFAATAIAADGQGRFVIKGAGITPCAEFVESAAKRDAKFVSYAGWIEGYLSAVNRYEDETYDIVAWQGTELLMAAMARYCGQNPDVSFHDATIRMATQLRRSGLREKSEILAIPIGTEGKSVLVYAAIIERLQKQLAMLGIYAGPASGTFDEATRAAVQAFQASKGLAATGAPDQETLAHLLR